MEPKVVITISREYGSGGREVGRLLAEKLNIPFYDKELLTYLAQESGLDPDLFKSVDAKVGFANFYFNDNSDFKVGASSLRDLGTLSVIQRIQSVQEVLIKKLAQTSCVIIGRCSNYILRDDPQVIDVFIRADLVDKKKRAVNQYGEAIEGINERLMEVDMRRAKYYNYFCDRAWGKASNYDLLINTSHLTLEDAAEIILKMVELRELKK